MEVLHPSCIRYNIFHGATAYKIVAIAKSDKFKQ